MNKDETQVVMKFRTVFIIPLLIASATVATVASGRGDKPKDKGRQQKVERTTAANPNVTVSVCLVSGDITVHGWDRNEVRARSNNAARLEFRGNEATPESGPAKKIEVFISDQPEESRVTRSCLSSSDIELYVPRGAAVQLQTRDGDITVVEVAMAYVNTQNGDIEIERASRSVDAGSIGGSISLKDSSGRINLHSIGGGIEAIDVRPAEADDLFEASSVSGDVVLSRIAHAQLNAHTVNGSLSLTGPLARAGRYGFRTYSGDVTLTLPADASFRLSAKISRQGEIITDFPLTLTAQGSADPPAPPAPASPPDKAPKKDDAPKKGVYSKTIVVTIPYAMHRVEAIYGTGDATIYVASFSGTVHLRKK
jgi:DUF4097 and DUF4098 domain-containing protein YvlB